MDRSELSLNGAERMRKHCGNIAEILRKHCGNIAETLRTQCGTWAVPGEVWERGYAIPTSFYIFNVFKVFEY